MKILKFDFKNLNPIKKGEIELNKLTVLCGKNNTGKTYITNSIYSFLDKWDEHIEWTLPKYILEDLTNQGLIRVDLEEVIVPNLPIIFSSIEEDFQLHLAGYLACSDIATKNAKMDFSLKFEKTWKKPKFEATMKSINGENFLTVKKPSNSSYAEIMLAKTDNQDFFPSFLLNRYLTKMLSQAVIKLPPVFIASAERTGATIFKNELNFGRNQLVNYLTEMDSSKIKAIDPFQLLSKFKRNYSLSVIDNVEFISNLANIQNRGKSDFIKNNPQLLTEFMQITGGEYLFTPDTNEVVFKPQGSKETVSLVMGESSSTVRALMIIWYWLNYIAKKNSLLIIDEPELNLHPANQRKFARFIATLIQADVRVFLTTHSDYIIRELNTLLIMGNSEVDFSNIKEKYGYKVNEKIKLDEINVYVAQANTTSNSVELKKLAINYSTGIKIESFDEEIRQMNQIQDALLYGDIDE